MFQRERERGSKCLGVPANIEIRRVELDPSLLVQSQSPTEPTCVVGICGGLLPAAARATANDMNQLLEISRKLVAVAFREGVVQWRRAMDIEGQPGHWAVAIVDVPPKQISTIIDAFNEDMVRILQSHTRTMCLVSID